MSLGNTYAITKNTTIDGAGHTISITGQAKYRIFYVPEGITLTLKNLTLYNGDGADPLNLFGKNGGAILNTGKIVLDNVKIQHNQGEKGGAIYNTNHGSVTIKNSYFSGNFTPLGSYWNHYYGGVIYMDNGTLDVNNTTFEQNSAYNGGVLYNNLGGVNINDSTFKNNFTQPTVNSISNGFGGTITINEAVGASGGAIYSNAKINIGNSVFDGNNASYAGGALFTHGGILLNNTFTSNKAKAQNGGAIADTGVLHSYTSTFDGNEALNGEGGAVFAGQYAETRLDNSTFKNNHAGLTGGAVTSRGDQLDLSGDLFVGNTASSYGGGIYSYSKTTNLVNSTLSNNVASWGGNLTVGQGVIAAVYNDTFSNDKVTGVNSIYSNGFIALKNTIVSNTVNATNCAGSNIWDGGTNLQFPNNSCGATIPVKDAKLSTLGNYGGPTMSMMLGAGSPAIDAASWTVCTGNLVNSLDQRGNTRPADGNADGLPACDIGAVEKTAIAYGGK